MVRSLRLAAYSPYLNGLCNSSNQDAEWTLVFEEQRLVRLEQYVPPRGGECVRPGTGRRTEKTPCSKRRGATTTRSRTPQHRALKAGSHLGAPGEGQCGAAVGSAPPAAKKNARLQSTARSRRCRRACLGRSQKTEKGAQASTQTLESALSPMRRRRRSSNPCPLSLSYKEEEEFEPCKPCKRTAILLEV